VQRELSELIIGVNQRFVVFSKVAFRVNPGHIPSICRRAGQIESINSDVSIGYT
jgi:hypothetical protein